MELVLRVHQTVLLIITLMILRAVLIYPLGHAELRAQAAFVHVTSLNTEQFCKTRLLEMNIRQIRNVVETDKVKVSSLVLTFNFEQFS